MKKETLNGIKEKEMSDLSTRLGSQDRGCVPGLLLVSASQMVTYRHKKEAAQEVREPAQEVGRQRHHR